MLLRRRCATRVVYIRSWRDVINFFINHDESYSIIVGTWIALLGYWCVFLFPTTCLLAALRWLPFGLSPATDVGSMISMSDVITEASSFWITCTSIFIDFSWLCATNSTNATKKNTTQNELQIAVFFSVRFVGFTFFRFIDCISIDLISSHRSIECHNKRKIERERERARWILITIYT